MEKDRSDTILEVNNLYAEQDFLDVSDAIRTYEMSMKKGNSGDIYEIASGKSRSLEVDTTISIINKNRDKISGENNSDTKKVNLVEIDTSKINELDWNPTFSVPTSLQDILNFHRNQYRSD